MSTVRTRFLHFVLYFSIGASAVTVIPLTLNLPKPYQSSAMPVTSDVDLLLKLDPSLGRVVGINSPIVADTAPSEFLVASVYTKAGGINATNGIYAAQDSFVRGAIDASAKHQHFAFRPDDVWFTILTQVGYYMRKHKDDQLVRDMWDNWDGKQPQRNDGWSLLSYGQNFWVDLVFQQRCKAKWLGDWVKPNFPALTNRSMGTVDPGENIMAQAVFMATSTPSFEPIAPFACSNGIPSISLLGTKADWIYLASKLTQMEKGAFGSEPTLYALALHPLLDRFIATFDIPNDPAIRLFWNDMITATPRQLTCQTTDVVTGWINGFHFWDGAGNKLSSHPSPLSNANDTVRINNIPYPWRKITELPTAIGDVRSCISMDAPWAAYDHTNAGMMAKSIKKGIPEGYKQAIHNAGFILPPIVGDGDHSILSPEPVWLTHWKEGGDVGPCCSDTNRAPCG